MSLLLHAHDFKSGDQVYYEGHGLQTGKPYSQPWIYQIKLPEELLKMVAPWPQLSCRVGSVTTESKSLSDESNMRFSGEISNVY